MCILIELFKLLKNKYCTYTLYAIYTNSKCFASPIIIEIEICHQLPSDSIHRRNPCTWLATTAVFMVRDLPPLITSIMRARKNPFTDP